MSRPGHQREKLPKVAPPVVKRVKVTPQILHETLARHHSVCVNALDSLIPQGPQHLDVMAQLYNTLILLEPFYSEVSEKDFDQNFQSLLSATKDLKALGFKTAQLVKAATLGLGIVPNPLFELMRSKHITPRNFDKVMTSPDLIFLSSIIAVLAKINYIKFPDDIHAQKERISAASGYTAETITKCFKTKEAFLEMDPKQISQALRITRVTQEILAQGGRRIEEKELEGLELEKLNNIAKLVKLIRHGILKVTDAIQYSAQEVLKLSTLEAVIIAGLPIAEALTKSNAEIEQLVLAKKAKESKEQPIPKNPKEELLKKKFGETIWQQSFTSDKQKQNALDLADFILADIITIGQAIKLTRVEIAALNEVFPNPSALKQAAAKAQQAAPADTTAHTSYTPR